MAGRVSRAAATVSTATPTTVNSPAGWPVRTRTSVASAVASTVRATTAHAAKRRMCVLPQGFSRAAEKMAAASAMSSTMRGAGGPAGTRCSASRSPSTTPTVSRVASRLYAAPPSGARDSSAPVPASGATMRRTAGTISRRGRPTGRATSVSRPRPPCSSPAASTATRTIGIAVLPDVLGDIFFPFSSRGLEVSGQVRRGEPGTVGQCRGQPLDRSGDGEVRTRGEV